MINWSELSKKQFSDCMTHLKWKYRFPWTVIEKNKLSELERDLAGRKEENKYAWKNCESYIQKYVSVEGEIKSTIQEAERVKEIYQKFQHENINQKEKLKTLAAENERIKTEFRNDLTDAVSKFTKIEDENNTIKTAAQQLANEHQVLKSRITGELLLTMRSQRRANMLAMLFWVTLLIIILGAIFGRKG